MIRCSRGRRGEEQHDFMIPDAGSAFDWNRVRESHQNLLLESLILAQDERWRRA